MTLFGIADTANEFPIIEQTQTSPTIFFVVSKTCKQAVQYGPLTKPALEKTCILSTRSSEIATILSEYLGDRKIRNR